MFTSSCEKCQNKQPLTNVDADQTALISGSAWSTATKYLKKNHDAVNSKNWDTLCNNSK